ncbi:TIGR04282 family arsenosugar biosynthesis glycosyltransferase [Galbibacter sp. BG1]|uniref:TIGR04282 family arsenosugar biosynthesis glycosyltransferase n=1 Tax=Galbibacter sp. BG1 TaxID=1170699 RepID=UPI0015BE6555|nr:TIGR04282 family arsenosugar biosynthesis glycosyltransferase [Galbibacter sp. BG1]QLE00783.1 TIGR04282 family arsenosugar biosynthesis glycosyltransferase [Galbibacter sp. BG1]
MKEKNVLLIFTRNPVLGKVKTRLAKTLGDEKALEIYKFLLNRTSEVTGRILCDKNVYYSEEIPKKDLWDATIFTKQAQTGHDLGARMANAFQESFAAGYTKVVIIGSDLYDLTEKHLQQAFEKLDDHDAVIGPAKDGGYYLLGLKQMVPEVFQQKNWGTSSVLRDTLQSLKSLDVALLEELNDIDIYDDIKEHPAFKKFILPN